MTVRPEAGDTATCPECDGRGEVAATPGQPGDGLMPCSRCQTANGGSTDWDEVVARFCAYGPDLLGREIKTYLMAAVGEVKELRAAHAETERALDAAHDRELALMRSIVEEQEAAEARADTLEQALRVHAEEWEHNAEEAEASGNSYRGHDNDAAVSLFRDAARARSRAAELRSILAAVLSRPAGDTPVVEDGVAIHPSGCRCGSCLEYERLAGDTPRTDGETA